MGGPSPPKPARIVKTPSPTARSTGFEPGTDTLCEETQPESVSLDDERDRVLEGMSWSIGEALAIVEGDLAGHIYVGQPHERGAPPPTGAIPLRVSAMEAPNAVVRSRSGEAGSCAGEELDGQLEVQLIHETWGVVAEGSAEVLLSEEAQYETFL